MAHSWLIFSLAKFCGLLSTCGLSHVFTVTASYGGIMESSHTTAVRNRVCAYSTYK